jgi:epoxyqueuosine reductase
MSAPRFERRLAWECGFELAGVAWAEPNRDVARYLDWAGRGLGGRMTYLAGRRAEVRADPKLLLPSARSIVCVGKLYNGPEPHSTAFDDVERAWISRYAWGDDYHDVMRRGLERMVARMRESADFEYRICVDTAPLVERSYARDAGLGWIGRNTCLINQYAGSWFFLGEVLVSIEFEPDATVADRCGTCTRCIEACPTRAIVPRGDGGYELDARLCISYFTIELRGAIPDEHRSGMGRHVFGCDICQDVCPWNRREAITLEPAFRAREYAPDLERLAELSETEFRGLFEGTPVTRARYTGFLRNVALAMGNSGAARFRGPLERLAEHADPVVSEHARWALARLESASGSL